MALGTTDEVCAAGFLQSFAGELVLSDVPIL